MFFHHNLFDRKTCMHAPYCHHHISRFCSGVKVHAPCFPHDAFSTLGTALRCWWWRGPFSCTLTGCLLSRNFIFLFFPPITILCWWYTTPKCSMKFTFRHLLLDTNHICPESRRLIHAVCDGKNLDDTLLGRDIIFYDCAEDLEEDWSCVL
jgi:hypothetical protein